MFQALRCGPLFFFLEVPVNHPDTAFFILLHPQELMDIIIVDFYLIAFLN